jgi:hypothetical protein
VRFEVGMATEANRRTFIKGFGSEGAENATIFPLDFEANQGLNADRLNASQIKKAVGKERNADFGHQ